MSNVTFNNDQLRALFARLPAEARSAVSDRALEHAMMEEALAARRELARGAIPEESYDTVRVDWAHVRAALCEYLGPGMCATSSPATPTPAGAHRPHQREAAPSFPKVVDFANLLVDNNALGVGTTQRPKGAFHKQIIRRESFADGRDVGILVSREPINTPSGPANQFYVFTKLTGMGGGTDLRYFGPFDDSIIPTQ